MDQRALLRKYETELRRLKKELEDKNRMIMDKEVVYKLEEERRRAEEDKAAAITALETRSREYMCEKEEKKKLEEKIRMMNSQMLIGGQKIEDTPQFRNALEAKHKIIREEYDLKLQEIENERQQIEEDKAQVDRYKQLLLKQRDIMIALTARLNERDETIIQLQEELDAYDRIHREAEEALERKAARIGVLENTLISHSINLPHDPYNYLVEGHLSQRYVGGLEPKYPPLVDPLQIHDDDQDTQYAPLSLLTSDEKVNELMAYIQQQKVIIIHYIYIYYIYIYIYYVYRVIWKG